MTPLIFAISFAVLVAAITCYSNWKEPNEEKYKRKNNIAISLFIFAILTQGLTFYNGYTTIQNKIISDSLNVVKERENKALNDSLRITQNKIILLQNALLDTTNTILITSLNSNRLQKRINDLQGNTIQEIQEEKQLQLKIHKERFFNTVSRINNSIGYYNYTGFWKDKEKVISDFYAIILMFEKESDNRFLLSRLDIATEYYKYRDAVSNWHDILKIYESSEEEVMNGVMLNARNFAIKFYEIEQSLKSSNNPKN